MMYARMKSESATFNGIGLGQLRTVFQYILGDIVPCFAISQPEVYVRTR
jgi:hypothetical protein